MQLVITSFVVHLLASSSFATQLDFLQCDPSGLQLHFVDSDLVAPISAWAASNPAELAPHLGNMAEFRNSKSTKCSRWPAGSPCTLLPINARSLRCLDTPNKIEQIPRNVGTTSRKCYPQRLHRRELRIPEWIGFGLALSCAYLSVALGVREAFLDLRRIADSVLGVAAAIRHAETGQEGSGPVDLRRFWPQTPFILV